MHPCHALSRLTFGVLLRRAECSANEQVNLPFEDPLLSVLLTKLGPRLDGKLAVEEDWTLTTAATAGADGEEGPQRSDPGSGTGEKLVNAKAWTVNFHDLELIKPIGEGSFGRVSAPGCQPG